MEKHNFKHVVLIFIISNAIFSQSKTIVPKSGTIVFSKEELFLDRELYLNSMKELLPKNRKVIEEQIYLERLSDGKKTDTAALKYEVNKMIQNFEMMLPLIVDEPKQNIKFYNEFKGDTINYYTSIDGYSTNEKIINRHLGTITNNDGVNIELVPNNIINLTEFRTETKLIKGSKCFKVIYTFKQAETLNFDLFLTSIINIRELWVTDTINCSYHPVIVENEILKKYYPLEIIEYSEEIKGFIVSYKLVEFNIQ